MSSKKIVLCSSDKEKFEVEEEVMLQSETIKHMVEDGCFNDKVPVINVHSKTLSKIIDYCNMHAHNKDQHVIEAWDAAQFANVDHNTLYDLMMAANYLNIGSLVDLLFQTLANMINGNSVEEICDIFKIENNSTPNEEEEVQKESP